MKLKELNEKIAAACEMTPRAIAQVQAETFRRIDAALAQGERVQIPDFGIFSMRDIAGEEGQPARKVVRFRRLDDDAGGKVRKKRAKAGGEAEEAPETAEAAE